MADAVIRKLFEHDKRFDRYDTKFEFIEREIRLIHLQIEELQNQFNNLDGKFEDFKRTLERILEALKPNVEFKHFRDSVDRKFEKHDHRIGALELITSKD